MMHFSKIKLHFLLLTLVALFFPVHSPVRADTTKVACEARHGSCEEVCGATDDASNGACTDQLGAYCCIPPEGTEVTITEAQCTEQTGHVENIGYCNNGDRRIAKVPGIAGRICCVPIVNRSTIAPALCTAQGGTCAPVKPVGDSCQSDETLIGSCKDASLADGKIVCCKKNTPSGGATSGSNSGTSSNPSVNYTLLEKIPGIDSTNLNLAAYLSAIYKLAIWIVGLCALFMFLVGAFMYMLSAANTSKVGSAKSIMQDALIGLVLALCSYLILYVINPDLVKLKLPTVSMPSGGGGATSGSGTAPSESKTPGAAWADDATIRRDLGSTGIQINRGNCTTEGQADACTSVAELGSAAIDGLKGLKAACTGCQIMVNGGTEYWLHGRNTSHQKGNSVVDINRNEALLSYLRQSGQVVGQCRSRNIYNVNGAEYWDEDDKHFHVNFAGQACKHS